MLRKPAGDLCAGTVVTTCWNQRKCLQNESTRCISRTNAKPVSFVAYSMLDVCNALLSSDLVGRECTTGAEAQPRPLRECS